MSPLVRFFNKIQNALLLFLLLIPVISIARPALEKKNIKILFSGVFRPDLFYVRNGSFLNSNNLSDQFWYARHIFDLKTDVLFGEEIYGKPISEFLFTVRNKAIWGNPRTIAFTDIAVTRDLNDVGQPHKHGIPRNIFWMREIWLSFDLNTAIGLGCPQTLQFKMGAFSFQLGRGIALGDAYAVGPELLGFFTDSMIDQFAYGALLSGEIIHDVLSYDLYTAILQNKSSTLGETGERILSQEYGRRSNPARGFGKVNFVVAGRFRWTAFSNDLGILYLEPYGLANHDPEQKIEFIGDATSHLGTLGLAMEYEGPRFELGFDYAFNLGYQQVKGWDRNHIRHENRNGEVIEVYTHIVDQDGNTVPFTGIRSPIQLIVYPPKETDAPRKPLNGQEIGQVPGVLIGGINEGQQIGLVSGTNVTANTTPLQMFNAKNRFRDPYKNVYQGWMFVIDGSLYLIDKQLKFSGAAGISTGDENPNRIRQDSNYSGFIPLQELYPGKRVKSVFLLGGAGKLNRPLSVPTEEEAPSPFADVVNGFTNIVFCGASMMWEPKDWSHKIKVNPNILAYWQEHRTHKFDAQTRRPLPELASPFLGVEADIFVDYYIFSEMRIYFVGSVFFPGQHYKDIRGLPLNKEQLLALNEVQNTANYFANLPNFGNDIAYTINVGFEFKF